MVEINLADMTSIELIVSWIFFVLCSSALTSGWLTSPWFEGIRNWLSGVNNKFSTLAICALCSGFWFALATEWIFIPYLGVVLYTSLALGSAAISWLLYSFTMACAWIIADIKRKYVK